MQHAKFQDYRTVGSEVEDISRLKHIWACDHLVHLTQDYIYNFMALFPKRLHKKFGFD